MLLFLSGKDPNLSIIIDCKWLLERVDLHKPKKIILQIHTPKMFIIQFNTSNVWENASLTFFIKFLKIIEKRFELVSAAIWSK